MRTIYVKPWDGCNLACDMCYNAQMVNHQPMSQHVLRRAFIEILKIHERYGDVLVHLHGGEPLVVKHPEILDFCHAVREAGCQLTVTTNLTYKLDPPKMDILRTMSPSPDGRFEHFIQTSWDYGTVRWKSDADRSLFENNVQRLRSLGFGIQGTVCVTKPLIDAYRDREANLLEELGTFFQVINFERLTLNGNLLDHQYLIPTPEEVDGFFLRLWKVYKTNPKHQIPILDNIVFTIRHPGHWLGCRARECSDTVLTINPDGSVATCPNVSHQPNRAIVPMSWEFKPITLVKKEEALQSSSCLGCDVFHVCHGDCYQLRRDSGCYGLYNTIHAMIDDINQGVCP